jgi:hypothetical protein
VNAQDRRLSEEAAKWRRRYVATREVCDEQAEMLLAIVLRERLADPSDFHVFIGIDAVRDAATGGIRWARLDDLVDELLDTKPHLAAGNPWKPGTRAVEFFKTET